MSRSVLYDIVPSTKYTSVKRVASELTGWPLIINRQNGSDN